MVLSQIASQINPFGGFAPFPNSIMIPVMGLQSDIIGYKFGFGYEMGKRTVRAMSNEQFNGLNDTEIASIQDQYGSSAIARFQADLPSFVPLQEKIIDASVQIEAMKANRTPSALAEIITALNAGAYTLPQDAISKFVQQSPALTDAINSLTAISPFLGLLGIKETSGAGTTEPVPSEGLKIRGTRLEYDSVQEVHVLLVYPLGWQEGQHDIEFNYDTTKTEELNQTLTQTMTTLGDKYGGAFFNQPVDWFNGQFNRNQTMIQDMEKFVIALMKWNVINHGHPDGPQTI